MIEALRYKPKIEFSISVGVVVIIHCLEPSGHAMALRSIQPLTEMSTRNFLGGKAAGA